jgi:hypothetical protein
MQFALGYIAGLVTATFIAALIAFFKQPVQNVTERLYRDIQENAKQSGFGQKGFIYEPESDADIARREHIAANSERGIDTPISELQ